MDEAEAPASVGPERREEVTEGEVAEAKEAAGVVGPPKAKSSRRMGCWGPGRKGIHP